MYGGKEEGEEEEAIQSHGAPAALAPICVYVYRHVCVCVCVCVCVFVFTYTYTCVCMYSSVYVCMH